MKSSNAPRGLVRIVNTDNPNAPKLVPLTRAQVRQLLNPRQARAYEKAFPRVK